VTDGIKLSDDAILHIRTYAYCVSVELRTGTDLPYSAALVTTG